MPQLVDMNALLLQDDATMVKLKDRSAYQLAWHPRFSALTILSQTLQCVFDHGMNQQVPITMMPILLPTQATEMIESSFWSLSLTAA